MEFTHREADFFEVGKPQVRAGCPKKNDEVGVPF
jgi:hypothetical protein